MNFNHMEYFAALARERSFTRAAEQLHITQQSLSGAIASLEKELGCQLVIRRVPLELTYAGEVFLQYAAEFLRRMDDMRQEFCDITANQRGILRVGIAHTRGRAIMPELVASFQRQYPNIAVDIAEAANDALHKKLLNREIDLAIANFPNALPGVALRDFYQEEVVLLIADGLLAQRYGEQAGSVLAAARAGNLAALRDCPFVMGDPADIAAQIGSAVLRQAGFTPAVKAKSHNMETLLSLCANGVGGCFCPDNLARGAMAPSRLKTLHRIPLGDAARYPIRFGYLQQSYPWSILTAFMDIAREITASPAAQ